MFKGHLWEAAAQQHQLACLATGFLTPAWLLTLISDVLLLSRHSVVTEQHKAFDLADCGSQISVPATSFWRSIADCQSYQSVSNNSLSVILYSQRGMLADELRVAQVSNTSVKNESLLLLMHSVSA